MSAQDLSNGRYHVYVSARGTGCSTCGPFQLTAWSADPIDDRQGQLIYLRDVDSGDCWSAARAPLDKAPQHYAATRGPSCVEITRIDGDIETVLTIAVAAAADLELRRLCLRNVTARRRRIEVTTYTEIVLNEAAAHSGHPAFSKLFVQTDFDLAQQALLARRRPRSATEHTPWLAQTLVGAGSLQYETDRARFLGRGRTASNPLALATSDQLSATTGNVLDPVFSLRRSVELAPGASARLYLLTAVGDRRDAVLAVLQEHAAPPIAEAVVEQLRQGEPLEALDVGDSQALPPRRRPVSPAVAVRAAGWPASSEPLQCANGYGGFSADGREYVIQLQPGAHGLPQRPPMPWVNVIANEGFGFLVSESGAGCTWSRNSRQNRLTPWYNDPISDPHGEALYICDEDAGLFWSPLPGPVPANAGYETRHGFGYSLWRHLSHELEQEVCMFAAARDPLKLTRLRLTNTSGRARRLSVVAYQQLVLGILPSETAASVVTEYDAAAGIILAHNPHNDEFSDGVVFAAAVAPAEAKVHATADRAAFLGAHGHPARPQALCSSLHLDGRSGAGLDPCAALQVIMELPAGATLECVFLLGETTSADTARALVDAYRLPGAVDVQLLRVQALWSEVCGAVQVDTPSPAINLMVNGWLTYQTLSCRLWGRSAFYQAGGAFGFRDQLQDAAALIYTRPDLTRAQIVLNAAHQFVEGDVLHWWHPPLGHGTRTRFSDDLVWLPFLTSFYVDSTGDWGVLDEITGFLKAPLLEPGEDEAYLLPESAGEQANVYEHCCRVLDRSLTRGAHGLPLMGTGDWNDGMNRVGREGRGESVWMGFFLYSTLGQFIPICERRGDQEHAATYGRYRADLAVALNDGGWDGAWYRRAYFDDGTPLGSAANDECRIDALAQAWAVLSGVGPIERAAQAMDAVETYLIDDAAGIIKLLAPPFDRTPHDPGYIKGYVPGIRENGGQYTHAAMWVVRALAEMGRRQRAVELFERVSPIHHARNAAAVGVYQVEPYVVAADIYGVAPHLGRGGWTWYTGSAGWMLRVAIESILGLTIEGGETLCLRPRIPDTWPGFTMRYRLADATTYEIHVANPNGNAAAVKKARLDASAVHIEAGVAHVPLRRDGKRHRVELELG
jgi:cyclic beta-1,2-glucan synthetase